MSSLFFINGSAKCGIMEGKNLLDSGSFHAAFTLAWSHQVPSSRRVFSPDQWLWMKSIAKVVYPPRDKVFKALQTTRWIKGFDLGQDPYHGPDQAQGLSFSVPDHVPAPPSLQNILKELRSDVGKRSHDLTSWAEQGVLLLNACLTVPASQANGHTGQIWGLSRMLWSR